MTSLVSQLQADALNSKVPISELLQKCLVVATKLGIEPLADWTRLELGGYGDEEVPEYRIVRGEPQVFNPYNGYQPLYFGDATHAERFSQMSFNQPIGEIEYSLLQIDKTGSGHFAVGYATSVENMLRKSIKFNLRPSLAISPSQFKRILDAARKIALEWSLKLEADGILGEGMTFSREEKTRAQAQSVTYNIKNFIQGDLQNSQVQVDAVSSRQTMTTRHIDLQQLVDVVRVVRASLGELPEGIRDSAELAADIQTIELQAASPSPKHSIIREALCSVRSILENAAGNLLAAGLLDRVSRLLGS